MKCNHGSVAVTAAVAAFAALVTARVARGGQEHAAHPHGGPVLSMARFYSGAAEWTGDFPGKLVCLRCDLKPGPGAMAQCEQKGHRHALSMEDDAMIHPLLAGTEDILKQINSGDLHGKNVTVHGKYYPSTGAILVDRISAGK